MTSYTVETSSETDATQWNNSTNLVRAPSGRLWATYESGSDDIFIAYSDDNENWTEIAVTSSGSLQNSPAIAVDSNGYVHVVWTGQGWGVETGNYNIQYRKYTDSLQDQESVTDVAYNQSFPAIAIDSSDYPRVVWAGTGWGVNTDDLNIQYRKRTTSWQAQEAITDNSQNQFNPSIAVDSSDYDHVIWYGLNWGVNTSDQNIQYRKRTDSWQAQEAITDNSEDQLYPCVALDQSGNVHAVWTGLNNGVETGNYNIQYRKRTTSWQDQEGVTDISETQDRPSVMVDANGYVHVSWNGYGWGVNTAYNNIQYRKRTDSWQAQVGITDDNVHHRHSSMVRGIHPKCNGYSYSVTSAGYAFVWTADVGATYSVKIEVSADLAWQTCPSGRIPVSPSSGAYGGVFIY
jgi:ribosomal protein L31